MVGKGRERRCSLNSDEKLALLLHENPKRIRRGQVYDDGDGWALIILASTPNSTTWNWIEPTPTAWQRKEEKTFFGSEAAWRLGSVGFIFVGRRGCG